VAGLLLRALRSVAGVAGMTEATIKAIQFPEMLTIPEGPKAAQPVKLAPFQKQFVKVALADGVNAAVVSIGRGNAKTGCFTTTSPTPATAV
jgi:hypothetical protein